MKKKKIGYLDTVLTVESIAVPTTFILTQLKKCYVSSIIVIFFTMALISYLTVSKRSKLLLLALVMRGISLWAVYYIILSPLWVLANGDLLYMCKVAEETVWKAHYPFNDTFLVSKRANYVFYPVPFLLQATLSIVTGIDVRALMYIPILMFASYLLIIIITLMIMKNCPKKFIPFSVIPILSFLSPRPIYFIYSHITRAILYLLTYVLFIKLESEKKRNSTLLIIGLLTISSVLGHVQEPITYLILYLLILIALAITRKTKISLLVYPSLFFISLLLIYNIYVSTQVSKSIVSWLYERLLTALLPEASPEIVVEKVSIAQSVLTSTELIVMIVGFITMALYVSVIMVRCVVRALVHSRNYEVLATVIALFTYSLIALMPILIPGMGTDLFWRPLWSLFIITSIWPIAFNNKYKDTRKTNNEYITKKRVESIAIICLAFITIILYGFSNSIYLRDHLISSDVYRHEALTITIIYRSHLLNYISDCQDIVIVDSPRQPAYEISRALTYIFRERCTILKLYLEVEYYDNLKYLNGIIKARELKEYITSLPEENCGCLVVIGALTDTQDGCWINCLKGLVFSVRNIAIAIYE